MSLGQMTQFIEIILPCVTTDTEGFFAKEDIVKANIRAYREGRHGSELWANRAVFSSATDLFRFRKIPNLTITTDMVIISNGQRFEITSVENIKGKGMYMEVLAKEIKPSG